MLRNPVSQGRLESGYPGVQGRRSVHRKRATIVAMIGGSTWDQINAIRCATTTSQRQLMIVTTSIYSNETLIQSLDVDWREA